MDGGDVILGFMADGIRFMTDGPSFLYRLEAGRLAAAYRRMKPRIMEFLEGELGHRPAGPAALDCRTGVLAYGTADGGHVRMRYTGLFRPPYELERL